MNEISGIYFSHIHAAEKEWAIKMVCVDFIGIWGEGRKD